jgi:hypothetical protein
MGGKLVATIDARLVDIVDQYRKAIRRTAYERVHLRNSMLVNSIGDNAIDKDGATTGLAVGQKVYFKPGGETDFEKATITQIAVEKVRGRSKSPRISVWVRLLGKSDKPTGEPIKLEFDPLTFRIEEATDPNIMENIPLIYRTDLGDDPVLWRPPAIKAEFRVARRTSKKASAKGGKPSGAKDTTGQNPREQR